MNTIGRHFHFPCWSEVFLNAIPLWPDSRPCHVDLSELKRPWRVEFGGGRPFPFVTGLPFHLVGGDGCVNRELGGHGRDAQKGDGRSHHPSGQAN